MSYLIQFATCTNRVAAMRPPAGREYEKFATYSDRLLLNQDLLVDIPDAQADEHINEVLLTYDRDGQPVRICSIYLLCPCEITVDNTVHKSDLLVPEKQLILPR